MYVTLWGLPVRCSFACLLLARIVCVHATLRGRPLRRSLLACFVERMYATVPGPLLVCILLAMGRMLQPC